MVVEPKYHAWAVDLRAVGAWQGGVVSDQELWSLWEKWWNWREWKSIVAEPWPWVEVVLV